MKRERRSTVVVESARTPSNQRLMHDLLPHFLEIGAGPLCTELARLKHISIEQKHKKESRLPSLHPPSCSNYSAPILARFARRRSRPVAHASEFSLRPIMTGNPVTGSSSRRRASVRPFTAMRAGTLVNELRSLGRPALSKKVTSVTSRQSAACARRCCSC